MISSSTISLIPTLAPCSASLIAIPLPIPILAPVIRTFLPSRYFPKNYKYITTIRNPIDRTKSFYEMQLNNKKLSFNHHSKKGLSIFLTKLKINQNCLCKFIIGDLNTDIDDTLYKKAKNNLRNFWYIIDFENLDEDIKKLANKLDINSGLEHLGQKKRK